MLIRAPTIFFILAVSCWCTYNNAIPLTSHPKRVVQDATTQKKTNFYNNRNDTARFHTRRMAKSFAFDKKSGVTTENLNSRRSLKTRNKNYNENVNINVMVPYGSSYNSKKRHDKHQSAVTSQNSEEKIFGIAEEHAENCASGRRKNQRYTSSFTNSTNNFSVDQEFDKLVGNNSKAKTITSVHEGEDMTLCWIETTTIKEDKNVRPPKRLVIREYTISFENSATIPDRYLECKRFEGELLTNDPEIGKTALFEIIDENTQVSRVVNFTAVSHDGDITEWQYKTVKCGVGPVVTKNIIEYNKSQNPKKRVEIKVSPKINLLTAKTTDEEPCTDSTEESTTDKSNVTESCENGSCGVTAISHETPSQDVVTTERTVSESPSYEDSGEILKLSTGVTKKPSSEESVTTAAPKISTTISEKTLDCNEDPLDPECLKQKTDVTPPLKGLSTESSVELTTTQTTEKSETSTSKQVEVPNLSDYEISTEEEISAEESSLEEDKSISDLSSTEETDSVTFIPDISIESSESATIRPSTEFTTISKSFDYYDRTATTLKPIVTTPAVTKTEIEQKRATSEEVIENVLSSELTKKDVDDSDNVLFSNEISTSSEVIPSIETEHETETIIASKEEESKEVTSEDERTTETETVISASEEEGSEEVVTSEDEETTETETIISASKEEETEEVVTSESEETAEQSTESVTSEKEGSKEVVTSESEETIEQSTETIISASKEEEESEEVVTSESEETIDQSTETIISASKEEERHEEVVTSEIEETIEQSTETISASKEEEEEEGKEVVTSESKETIEQSTEISVSKEKESEKLIPSKSKETAEHSTETIISASKEEESKEVITSESKETTERATLIPASKEEESQEKIEEASESEETVKESTESVTSTFEEEGSEEVITFGSEETVERSTETAISASEEEESEETSTEKTVKITEKDRSTPSTSSESESSCENSEDCVSSSEAACDESEDCGSTKKSCESETCSEEETAVSEESKSDTSSASAETSEEVTGSEVEHTTVASDYTTIAREEGAVPKSENVPTTVETRRSTLPDQRHMLNLKVRILLEHVDENQEKHNLVEVEKHLSLNEDMEDHQHPELIEQLKALNDSVNLEALNALLNCTTLGNLKNDPHISEKLNNTSKETFKESNPNSKESYEYFDSKPDQEYEVVSRRRGRRSVEEVQDTIKDSGSTSQADSTMKDDQLSTTTISIAKETTVSVNLVKDDTHFVTSTDTLEEGTTQNPATTQNPKEETIDTFSSTQEAYFSATTNTTEDETTDSINVESKNVTLDIRNETAVSSTEETSMIKKKIDIVQQALFKLREDISKGFQCVMSQLHSQPNLLNDENKTDKPNLLDIISDPKDDRIHSRKRREIRREGQLGHWSNERIGEAPMGSKLRSFTEFTLYKNLS